MPILDLEFITARYEFELDRKEKLTTAMTLPVVVLSAIGSAIAVMARSFTYADPKLTWIFVCFVAVSLSAFLICLVLLGRAYLAQTYVYLPLLRELTKSRGDFLDYAKLMAGGEAEVLQEFEGEFQRRMIAAADRNTESNEHRSKFLHWARIALFCVLVFALCSAGPYVVDQARFAMPPEPVAQKPKTEPAPTPPKPTFPENRVIKEGRDPAPVIKK